MNPSDPGTFDHRLEKLPTGRSYHFVDQKPQNYEHGKTITLLLVHGFPDLGWYGWRNQIGPWVNAGYRVIVPDMLGYGDTDKPQDIAEYTTKKLSDDLAAILDFLGIEKAVAIGHDWGSFAVSRFALWHPHRLLALAQLSVPYTPPRPTHFTLEQLVGLFPGYGYQLYFEDPCSTEEIQNNIEKFLALVFTSDHATSSSYTEKGKLQSIILGHTESNQDIPSLLSEEEMKIAVSRLKDSMYGPLCYYRTGKLRYEEELALGEGAKIPGDLLYMFIRGSQDPTCPPSSEALVRKQIPQARTVALDAGHWVLLEAKDRVVKEVLTWLGSLASKSRL